MSGIIWNYWFSITVNESVIIEAKIKLGLPPIETGLRAAEADDPSGQAEDRIAVLEHISPDDPLRMRLHVASQYSRRFGASILNHFHSACVSRQFFVSRPSPTPPPAIARSQTSSSCARMSECLPFNDQSKTINGTFRSATESQACVSFSPTISDANCQLSPINIQSIKKRVDKLD